MLPFFKRKLHIVVSGKTLFKQQRGDVGAFFIVLIMATIIAGSFYITNGVPSRFYIQDPLDPRSTASYQLNEKKIAKGKKNALQLKDVPFVSNTPTPEPESREPNDRGGGGRSGRPEPTRRQGGRNGDDEIAITRGPTKPPREPSDNSCGIGSTRQNGNCCKMDGPVDDPSECCEGTPTCKQIQENPGKYSECKPGSTDCHIYVCDEPNPGYWCNAKPIIYLYPTHPILVNVAVTASGPIVISDPVYPKNGWKNVLAHPDGRLIYHGRQYKELFYEAAIPPLDPPKTGVIVRKESVKQELVRIATLQGLVGFERDDFVTFWNGRLSALSSPYVLLSVFSQETKETFDHVIISPTPDTFIQFIAYFKPLKNPYPIAPLVLPNNPPERKGFTAVEWGGILDD